MCVFYSKFSFSYVYCNNKLCLFWIHRLSKNKVYFQLKTFKVTCLERRQACSFPVRLFFINIEFGPHPSSSQLATVAQCEFVRHLWDVASPLKRRGGMAVRSISFGSQKLALLRAWPGPRAQTGPIVPLAVCSDPCCFCAGLSEADANQNNGGVSQKPAVTDSTGAEGPRQPWSPANTADPDEATPRPHLARLFSRDAPGREDNTFKERPSESDELQTIQEHSGAASENPDEDLD